jgi:hypothetical protein
VKYKKKKQKKGAQMACIQTYLGNTRDVAAGLLFSITLASSSERLHDPLRH